MLKKLRPNTLLKKCVCLISAATCIFLMAAIILMSDWYNHFMLQERQNTYRVLTEGVASKISYILHQNTQYLLKYLKNTELMDQIIRADVQGTGYGEVSRQIEGEYYGSQMEGALSATRNLLIFYDGDTLICRPEFEPYAAILRSSEWFERTTKLLADEADDPEILRYRYSPAFDAPGDQTEEQFFADGICWQYGGHRFLFFLIEPASDFQNILETFDEYGLTDYCLVGVDNEILYQHSPDSVIAGLTSRELPALFADQQYQVVLTEKDQSSFFGVRVSYPTEDLKLIATISNSQILSPYSRFFRQNIGLLILYTLFLIVAVFLIVWTSLRRLGMLSGQMAQVREKDYRLTRKITGSDEVGVLADTFYNMVDKINEDIQVIQEKEANEKRLQYSLMVSQVDPHFIYNTLDTINYLAELNRVEDIQILNRSLIRMLRDRLKIFEYHAFDTLGKELEQLQDYLTIQKYLCAGGLELQMQVQEDCLSLKYPKHILQPLAENAILHGILLHRDEQRRRIPGILKIRIRMEGEVLVTELEDNGTGMSEEEIQKYFADPPEKENAEPASENKGQRDGAWAGTDGRHSHIGIFNIRNRMHYLYGDSFRMTAQNVKGGSGLIITVRIKISRDEREHPDG